MSGRTTVATVLLLTTFGSGCAAVKATQQPDKRNMAVLDRGVPRRHVIAELGKPVWSNQPLDTSVDVFSFKQGYSKTTKATRALVHGAADVFTLGLWEVVGIPAESIADGTDVQVEVHYDPDQTVDHVVVIKGEKAVHPPKIFDFPPHKRPNADADATSVAETPRKVHTRPGAVVTTSSSAVR